MEIPDCTLSSLDLGVTMFLPVINTFVLGGNDIVGQVSKYRQPNVLHIVTSATGRVCAWSCCSPAAAQAVLVFLGRKDWPQKVREVHSEEGTGELSCTASSSSCSWAPFCQQGKGWDVGRWNLLEIKAVIQLPFRCPVCKTGQTTKQLHNKYCSLPAPSGVRAEQTVLMKQAPTQSRPFSF